MAPEHCPHARRVSGLVTLDFARQGDPDGSLYTGVVSVGVCEECGHIELYAKLHGLLCDWLRKTES
jgi:hypothetical protein